MAYLHGARSADKSSLARLFGLLSGSYVASTKALCATPYDDWLCGGASTYSRQTSTTTSMASFGSSSPVYCSTASAKGRLGAIL